MLEVTRSDDYSVIKNLFIEYSQIKGAEGCFVSFEKELADLKGFYKDGAILVGYEDSEPVGCIAINRFEVRIVVFLYPQRISDMQVIVTIIELEHQHVLWM